MIGLDTIALIDLFKEDKSIRLVLGEVRDEIVLNHILYLELMLGLDFENLKHKEEEGFYDGLFKNYTVLNLDFNASKKSSNILRELKRLGKVIGLFDCSIAGIYLSNGVNKLITKNKKHFENIKELEIIEY